MKIIVKAVLKVGNITLVNGTIVVGHLHLNEPLFIENKDEQELVGMRSLAFFGLTVLVRFDLHFWFFCLFQFLMKISIVHSMVFVLSH